MQFETTDRWKMRWPGAVVACVLVTGTTNPERSPVLDEHLDQLEHQLRDRYTGFDRAALRAAAPFAVYERYYKQFGQTYHVWRQVESVALKGKPIPRRAALVEAIFAAELSSGILTAIHDANTVGSSIVADVATDGETMTRFDGTTIQLDAGDMFMRDEKHVLSSVVKGPAAYGMVTPETTNALVTVYAPEGIGTETMIQHLDTIAANIRLISSGATIVYREMIAARSDMDLLTSW